MAPSDDAPAIRTGSRADDLTERFLAVRKASEQRAAPLSAEDQQAQSMPDASPVKWHLAHTTWFFETFLLQPNLPAYRPFDSRFGYLFNSYYEAMGERHPRPARGLLTRPSLAEVGRYRAHVDAAMRRLLANPMTQEARDLVVLGLAHEEQHQELILTDVLHLFSLSPLKPRYAPQGPTPSLAERALAWPECVGGVVEIGALPGGFAFDNETPTHLTLIAPFRIASRLATNGEWLAFMADGGYRRPELWLSDGWARVRAEGWIAPLYWEDAGDRWRTLTLAGPRDVDPDAPVTHVSFYEAAAFAAWSGKRLPSEMEWEHAVRTHGDALEQLDDAAWQWTSSAYSPYPGFAPAAGAVGEYNAKFMSGQMVLRGGACVTPARHARPTYRNFFYPHQRWMFSGVRLAENASEPESEFRAAVIAGLSAPRKRLSPKWFYDARGSALFEDICRVPEYYLTRQETSLLRRVAPEIASRFEDGATLVEFGSGASLKSRLLLRAAPGLAAYAPIDVSESALAGAVAAIRADFPALIVQPVVADFTRLTELGRSGSGGQKIGFFPGSTIGNFPPDDAVALMKRARELLGDGALFVIGADLAKDPETLLAAYDDAAGVTAKFNLNLLERINRELAGDFDLSRFAHRVWWNAPERRIEMHLEALVDHRAHISGAEFDFVAGETIHTENSYKYAPAYFAGLMGRAGWRVLQRWESAAPSFSVLLLQAG